MSPVSSVAENAGRLQVQLRRSDPSGDAVASLSSGNPFRLRTPPSVAFADGDVLSQPFDLILRDNQLPDGDETIALSAQMFGYQLGLFDILVTDFEPLQLTKLGGNVFEASGDVTFRLTRPAPASDALINLEGSIANFFQLPESVRFGPGSTEVTFVGTVIDNDIVSANPAVTVTAGSSAYIADSVTFDIIENDLPTLTLELDSGSTLEGTGAINAILSRNTQTDLTVLLGASLPGVLDFPASIRIPAGREFVEFEIMSVDNEVVNGTRQVDVTVSGAGHPNAIQTITITDDEVPGFEFTRDSISIVEGGNPGLSGIRLLAEPATQVIVNVASSDISQVTVSPIQLTFSPNDWNVPQDIVIDTIDDVTVELPQDLSVVASVTSNGPYAGLADQVLDVHLEDDDLPMILLEETDGSTIVNELGLDDTFTLRLGTRPQSDVQIVIDGDEIPEATFTPSVITFTPDNWDQDQVVTVSTPLDFDVDKNRIGSVYVNVDPTQSDAAYASAGQRIFAVVHVDSILNDLRVRTENDRLVLVDAFSGQTLRSSALDDPAGALVSMGSRSETVFVEALPGDVDITIDTAGGNDRISLEAMTGGLLDGGEGFDVVVLLASGELPSESTGGAKLRNIERLDLSDEGTQMLSLDAAKVQAMTDALNTLTVTVGVEDSVALSAGWSIGSPVLVEGVPTHSLSSNGTTIQLANGAIWQNPLDRYDVDRSGDVAPSDALAAINRLARQQDTTLPFFPGATDDLYYDVNGDGLATVRDPLAIINRLAAVANQSGLSGEATDLLAAAEAEDEPQDLAVATIGEGESPKVCDWHAETVDQAVDQIVQSDWLETDAEEDDEPVFGPLWNPLA